MTKGRGEVGIPFFVLGLAFIAIGAAQQRAFVGVGIVFLVLGIVQMRRSQRP